MHVCVGAHEQPMLPTYLPGPDIDIGEGVLPPMLLERLLLLPLDGLGVVILIHPLLRPTRQAYFSKDHQ